MKSNSFHFQVILLFMLSLIPWPGPTIFKISCPRDNARIVRKIVQTKWIPILEKFKLSLPLECPFHPQRDIFWPQQSAKKQHRASQWTCGICGKSFFEEKFLDLHFDNRHKGYINMAEDAVCLADYCDIMRCDVIRTQDFKAVYPEQENTDIEIWREASSYSKALATSGPRHVAKYTFKDGNYPHLQKTQKVSSIVKSHCQKTDVPASTNSKDDQNSNDNDKSQNTSNNICQNDMVDSALPSPDNRQQRIAEFQKLKANCKPEELQKIKTKCEILVRDCIAGLLIQLSVKDFKEVEEELNRAVCWYLTCDRYWEDSQSDLRSFPWGLICMIIMVLSLGICLCYYVIWVLFDSDDVSVTSASVTDRSTPSPNHLLRYEHSNLLDGNPIYTEDYYVSPDKDNEYIYVTYPPELKRRLLESNETIEHSAHKEAAKEMVHVFTNMTKAVNKWTPAVPKRRPDNIVSSKAREKGLLGFKPTYENDETYNMSQLLSMEYMRIWFKERAEYEKDAYTREAIIKQENKIKRRNVQRMNTYRRPTKNQFVDDRARDRMLGDKTIKAPPYTRDYNLFKYKPDCSRVKSKSPDAPSVQVVDGKHIANGGQDNAGNDLSKNFCDSNGDNVIEAEIVCRGNCKCHPNE